jgi:methylated-DNA-[protein]-cysteine S-methyltransferase
MKKTASLGEGPLPAERRCAIFETSLGLFGIAWQAEAVTLVLRPLPDREAMAAELQWRSGAELTPPPWPPFVSAAVAGIQALTAGEANDLREVPLDWAGIGQFERRVYEAARRIPPGQTRTYGELAHALGNRGLARAVDVALAGNPWPLIVPDHRVVAGAGRLGGHPVTEALGLKKRLLEIEAPLAAGAPAARRR